MQWRDTLTSQSPAGSWQVCACADGLRCMTGVTCDQEVSELLAIESREVHGSNRV